MKFIAIATLYFKNVKEKLFFWKNQKILLNHQSANYDFKGIDKCAGTASSRIMIRSVSNLHHFSIRKKILFCKQSTFSLFFRGRRISVAWIRTNFDVKILVFKDVKLSNLIFPLVRVTLPITNVMRIEKSRNYLLHLSMFDLRKFYKLSR